MTEQDLREENWFLRMCNGGLVWIACIVCGLLLTMNVFYTMVVTEGCQEQVVILSSAWQGVASLVVTAALTVGAALLPKPKKLREGVCFALLCGIYTAMALYLMLHSDSALRSDALLTYEAAQNFLQGDYQVFDKGGYVGYFPHQTGLMLYDALVSRFWNDPLASVAANFCFVLGIQYLLWRMADVLFHSREVSLMTMGLSFAFLPQFFFIMFIYGTIPGLFFLMLAFYQTLRFSQSGHFRNLLTAGLSIGIAVMLRKNYIIGAAAMGIFLLLRCLEERRKGKWLLAACVTLALAVLPNQLLLSGMEARTGCDLHRGMPSELFIRMGTNIDNRRLGPGWWDGTNSHTFFIEADYDPEVGSALGRQYLKENLVKIRENPRKAARFFWDKVVSTWCDPLYQSVWSGPLEDWNQKTHTDFLRSVYTGGRVWSVLETFCKWLTLTLWASALLFLLAFRKGRTGWQLCFLYTIGGVLFHLIWETKSQYVYPYLFCLIPFAAFALVSASGWWAGRLKRAEKG